VARTPAKTPGDTKLGPNTILATAGRHPFEYHGFVNPPVYHGSTVLYPTADDLFAHRSRYSYGRRGTPTTEALSDAITTLEGGAGTVLVPSGLAAITTAILSVAGAGDHILVIDSTYAPTRHFCDTTLKRLGVETTYYAAGEDFSALFRENTRAVFTESPGSLTFEMQDIPALAELAHKRGAAVLMDNTWATPLLFAAHAHGVDLSIQAGTKYFSGHSDVMMGSVSANADYWPRLRDTHGNLGLCAGPDDINLVLRGLRTLGVRLERHQKSGLEIAHWLEERPEVAAVLHPALESHPSHALWKRDFRGACGLFSIVLKPVSEAAVRAFLDALSLFGMGYSWGGYESLIIPFDARPLRTASTWAPEGPALRLHIGLEDVEDLRADLDRGFAALRAADDGIASPK